MDAGARLQVLRGVEAFSRLPDLVLRAIAERATSRVLAPGLVLMRQGDPPDGLWVVAEGAAEVRLRRRGGDLLLATAGPGTVVGEMALVTHAPRNADVVATQPGSALFLSVTDFADLERRLPEILGVLTELVAKRLGRAAQDGLGDKVLEGFRILRPVGRGATAVVYEAQSLDTGATVALKMLSHRLARDKVAMSWFEREASLLERLRHPQVAVCHGRFPAYGTRFLVMDFVDGPSLAEVLRRVGKLPEPEGLRVVGSVAAALLYVHERGVVHGDVKPANVMVSRDGTVRLTDFGIAATVDEIAASGQRPEAVHVSGTPRYMAPEMFIGSPRSASTDLYALGCVLWEVLAGVPAFRTDAIGPLVLAKRNFRAEDAETGLAEVSPGVRSAVARLLSPDAAIRVSCGADLSARSGPLSPEIVERVLVARTATS
jgi:CRP-like cAMP-binding protein